MHMCMVQSNLTYTHITIHIHYVILYKNIHTFTYTNILFNIHIHYIITIQYIKLLHNNNAYNTQQRVLNNRICY